MNRFWLACCFGWLLFSAAANADDIVILTSSTRVLAELERQLDLVAAPGVEDLRVFTAEVPGEQFDKPFSVVVAQASALSVATAESAAVLLGLYDAHYLLLLDAGMAIGPKLEPGDVAVSRMVWDYALAGESVTPLFARSFRSDAALINASLAADFAGPVPNAARPATMGAGAIAGGAWDDGRAAALSAAILAANDRTLATVPGAATVCAAVERYAAANGPVGVLLVVALSAGSDDAGMTNGTANAVGFALGLIRERWPSAPGR